MILIDTNANININVAGNAVRVATPSVSRFCRQCGTALTAPASINAGIGPICRGKANQVLAKEIPADIARADLLALLGVEFVLPSEANDRWQRVFPLLTAATDAVNGTGHDYRGACKDIAYVLSFDLPTMTVEALIGMVDALGYKTFALWLRGQVSTSPAEVRAEAGFVVLTAKRNSDGQAALKAAKIGAFFQAGAWRFPLRNAKAGCAIVARYWPMVTGIDAVIAAAPVVTPASLPVVVPVAGPEVVFTTKGVEIFIKSPYNANFVNAIKALPRVDRLWDQNAAAWVVRSNHLATLKSLVATHYPTATLIIK